MSSPHGLLGLVRRIGRRVARFTLGEGALIRSRALQRVLAFRADGRTVTDLNLCIPIAYVSNSVLGTLLFYRGAFEEEEIELVLELMTGTEGPVILDIGANIGWHSLRWATSRPDVSIYAFEPSINSGALLRRNILMNGVQRQIQHVSSAISEAIGLANFYECVDDAYSSLKDTGRKRIISTVTVPVTTVDAFVRDERLPHVTAIKIDVEGLETEVLRGAMGTLTQWAPEVVVEIFGGRTSNPKPHKTIEFMQSLGYRAFVWKNKELVPFECHSDLHFNYWFTKRDMWLLQSR